MNLTDYLKSISEKPYKFALRSGISRTPIYQILHAEAGKKPCRILLDTALKIRSASNGIISLEELGRVSSPCSAILP